jgi:anti-sigma B factor antagonist
MNYSVSERDGIIILALAGKIMGGPEATEINDQINHLIGENKLKVVIDLKNVEWMNSSGLGILIGAVSLLRSNNGTLILIHVSDRIKNLLKITKLNSVFELCETIDEALTTLKG